MKSIDKTILSSRKTDHIHKWKSYVTLERLLKPMMESGYVVDTRVLPHEAEKEQITNT